MTDAPDNMPDTLGEVMRQARKTAGIRQEDLARVLGISRWMLNRVENGGRSFQPGWLAKLPATMRRPVIAYFRRQHKAQIETLDDLDQATLDDLDQDTPKLIKRPTGAQPHDRAF